MSSGKGVVFHNQIFAGILEKTAAGGYFFRYDDSYFIDPKKPAISLTLPKKQQEYHSRHLFPFFCSLLSDGINKAVQCIELGFDWNDDFTHLLKTAHTDTFGAVTVKEL